MTPATYKKLGSETIAALVAYLPDESMLWKEANDSRAWSVSAYHLALLANMVAGYMWANSTPDERPAKPPQIPLPGQTNSDNTEAIPHTVAGQQVAVMTIEKFNQAHNYYQGQQQ